VATALRSALARTWSDDLVETRVALLDAAVAAGLVEGAARAKAAAATRTPTCAPVPRGARGAGESQARCPPRRRRPPGARPLAIGRGVHVVFETDAGVLGVRFDRRLAPIRGHRLVALARSGSTRG